MTNWQPTKHGGYRRTGVAQRKSSGRINRRSVYRKHPPVLIKWREPLGLPGCPYAIWWRVEFPFGSVRVHHWLAPDDDRALHDHPWWFITLVLRGGYTDHTEWDEEHLRAGSIRYRPALHQHTVVPDPGGAWTVLVTGARDRPLAAGLGLLAGRQVPQGEQVVLDVRSPPV